MIYPLPEEVHYADLAQLLHWTRFLPSPGMSTIGPSGQYDQAGMDREVKVMELILARQSALGGITPMISKQVGWNQ